MTWTLRFYDKDGVEIGYVERSDRETYTVKITHPDGEWDSLRSSLESKYMVSPPEDEKPDHLDGPSWRADYGPQQHRYEPERHLRLVDKRTFHPDVGHTKLVNE